MQYGPDLYPPSRGEDTETDEQKSFDYLLQLYSDNFSTKIERIELTFYPRLSTKLNIPKKWKRM